MTMRAIRNASFLVAIIVYALCFGQKTQASGSCQGVSYFNYGYDESGCGPYNAEGAVCMDLYYICDNDCASLGYPFFGGLLGYCHTSVYGDPSDGMYVGDAQCTCLYW
jgi:hypothetical protein